MKKVFQKIYGIIYLIVIGVMVAPYGCKKDRLLDDADALLRFGTDTLTFDTLFVTLGSTTRFFTVSNPYNKTVEISRIFLAGGENSRFRLTIDGDPGNVAEKIQIPPKDSIYVFVEVTVDPGQSDLPFLIEDSVIFITNNNRQRVVLNAYGQNARFYNGQSIETETWTNELPYVILNSLEVKEGHTLTIREGVKVYFGGNSGMFVNGTLRIEGGPDTSQHVVFRTYRLDRQVNGVPYDHLPGQWLGVFLLRKSSGHQINYLQMRGSQFGLNIGNTTLEELPDVGPDNAPDLKISNSRIWNASTYGIFGFLAKIEAENLLVHDCGVNAVSLILGGDYTFRHCTFYLRSSIYFDHRDPALYCSNYHIYDRTQPALKSPFKGVFTNCIAYGTLDTEVLPDPAPDTGFDFLFEYGAVRIKGDLPAENFINCLNNRDPQFRDVLKSVFRLSESSPCINIGKAVDVFTDIEGKPRDAQPDAGAYEYRPE